MDEEWRVSLIAGDQPAPGKPASAQALRDLLRGRVAEDVSVSAGKAGTFLYAATADAAATAEGVARDVLAAQGLAADTRLERWDPSAQAWLPAGDAAAAEAPSDPEPDPGRRRLRTVGAVIAALVDGIGQVLRSRPGSRQQP